MKKFLLMLTLVAGGLFLNACDKDDNDAKDPGANMIDYVGKPLATLFADCEKAGYTRTEQDGSGVVVTYTKGDVILLGQTFESNNIIVIAVKFKKTAFTTTDQVVSFLKATDKSVLAKYKDISEKRFKLNKKASDQSDYNTVDELCAEVKKQTLGYYKDYELFYVATYKGVEMVIQHRYSSNPDNQTDGATIETYGLYTK